KPSLKSCTTRRSSDLAFFMLNLNVKNETSRLRAVVLGTAKKVGPAPCEHEAYDPKSREHILAGTYPKEEEMILEMEAFRQVLEKDRKSTRLNSSHVKI